MQAEEALPSGMRELERLRGLLRWRVWIAGAVEVFFIMLVAAALAGAGAMAQLYAGWWVVPAALLAGGLACLCRGFAAAPGLPEAALFADRAAGLQGYASALLELARSPLPQTSVAAQIRADFLLNAADWIPRLAAVRVGLVPARARLLLLPLSVLLAQGLLWVAFAQEAGRGSRAGIAPGWIVRPVTGATQPGQEGAPLSPNDPAALRATELARRLEELRVLSGESQADAGAAGASGLSSAKGAEGNVPAGRPVVEYGGADSAGAAGSGQLRRQAEIPPAYARQVDAYLRARDRKLSE